MKKTNLVLSIVIVLILLGFGCSFSYFLGQKEAGVNKEACPYADLLSSKVVKGNFSGLLSGAVKEISDGILTLENEGDSLDILVKEDAPISRLVSPEKSDGTAQPASKENIKIGEIEIGDRANIACQLKADGTLEGKEIVILP